MLPPKKLATLPNNIKSKNRTADASKICLISLNEKKLRFELTTYDTV